MTEQNDWIEIYGPKINQMCRELEVCIYQGFSDGKLDLSKVLNLLKGSYNEVHRLHKEVNELKEDVRTMLKDHSADITITR
jgi:hypothetical protein